WFQIAVQHAPAVGIVNGIADINEPAQQFAELQHPLSLLPAPRIGLVKASNRLPETFSFDEAHGVKGSAVGVLAQAIDWHNPRALNPASNLGLQQETRPTLWIVCMPDPDLLQRHLPMQLLVQSNKDLAETTMSMFTKNPKASPRSLRSPCRDHV